MSKSYQQVGPQARATLLSRDGVGKGHCAEQVGGQLLQLFALSSPFLPYSPV